MTGLYEDVFQSGIMDLAVEAEVTGTFTHNAVFDSLTINGFGIVGRANCYTEPEIVNSLSLMMLKSSRDRIDQMLEISGDKDAGIQVIKGPAEGISACKTGNFQFEAHNAREEGILKNSYEGMLAFNNIQEMLGVLMSLADDDKVDGLLQEIKFPKGLKLSHSYE